MLGGNSHPYPSMHCFCLFLAGYPPRLTSMSPTSKGGFPVKYWLSIEKIPAKVCIYIGWPVKAIVTVHMHSLLEPTDSTVYCIETITVTIYYKRISVFLQKISISSAFYSLAYLRWFPLDGSVIFCEKFMVRGREF